MGEDLLSWSELLILQDHLPDNMYLKRGSKAWSNAETLPELIRLIARILEPYAKECRFIFSFAAVSLHFEEAVLSSIGAAGMFLFLLIPAKTTWLRKPLDLFILCILKRRWKKIRATDRPRPAGMKAAFRMVELLCEELSDLLCGRCWKNAFRTAGLFFNQRLVSVTLKKKIGLEAVQVLLPQPLSLEGFASCWPAHRAPEYAKIALALPAFPEPPGSLLALADAEPLPESPGALEAFGLMESHDPPLGAPVIAADSAELDWAASLDVSMESAPAPPPALRRRLSFKQPDA